MEEEKEILTAKLLLIEDDEDDYVLIRDMLSEIPYRNYILHWAPSYQSGIEAIEGNGFDVCLLDFRLGQQSGLEMLKVAKERGYQTPIVFLTGQGEYAVDVEAMKGGAADYLVKEDITPALLERAVRYTIERANDRKSLQRARDMLETRVKERTEALAEANRELEKINEKIKLFAYSVSHDLKSPAFSLYALAKRLRDKYEFMDQEKRREHCSQIIRAAAQVTSLVEKINVFIATKKTPLEIEAIQVREILDLMRDEFSEHLSLRKIQWSVPESPPVIRADRLSLIRVFRNLIDNALKYGNDPLTQIRIEFRESRERYILSVSDDGIGLEEKDPEKLFESFYRSTSSKSTEGLGLGLAIVKDIAEKHRGSVWFETLPLKGVNCYVSLAKSL